MSSNLPESQWVFSRVAGGYENRCPTLGITITAEEIQRRRDEMTALMTVRSTMVGLRTVEDDILKIGTLNFYAETSRASWAKAIARRCPGEAQTLDWDGFLERFVAQVIAAERIGEPLIDLSTLTLSEGQKYLLPDLISAEDPTIWFGDGGSMKSYLALAACAAIQTGSADYLGIRPTDRMNVGYVDWEFNPQAHRRRLGRMCQTAPLPPVKYIRCDRPLTYEVNRLQRLIREHHLGFLVLDSIVVSCDGPAENSDTVGRYLQAIRQLNVPTLLIAHVTKAEEGDKKPLGSVMWHNAARLTWYFRKAADAGDRVTIGLFNRKNSEDRTRDPLAFSFWFQPELGKTLISLGSMNDLANEPEIAEKLPIKMRIAAAVRDEPKTIVAIAEDLGLSVQTVSTTIRRGEGHLFTRVMGPDQVYRIALLSDQIQ